MMQPEEERTARRAKAIDLLIAAQEHRKATSPELAAKQAHLLALMKADTLTPKIATGTTPTLIDPDDPLHLAMAIAQAAMTVQERMAFLNALMPMPPKLRDATGEPPGAPKE